jgi:hypothetical protein
VLVLVLVLVLAGKLLTALLGERLRRSQLAALTPS